MQCQLIDQFSTTRFALQVTCYEKPNLFYVTPSSGGEDEGTDGFKVDTEIIQQLQKSQDQGKSPVKKGDVCLVKGRDKQETWWRARVLLAGVKDVQVHFVDTGQLDFVSQDRILPLPRSLLEHPLAAIQCGFKGDWSGTYYALLHLLRICITYLSYHANIHAFLGLPVASVAARYM